jgi:hypothetical protein
MVFPFLPASNLLFPVGFVVAERVLYLPSMGYCLIIALGVWQLKKYYPTVVRVGVAYLIVVYSAKAVVRNRDWHSSLSLFQSAVRVYPSNGKMWGNIGSLLDSSGNGTEAVKYFRQSIRVEPHYITAYNNLAYTLRGIGDMGGALQVRVGGTMHVGGCGCGWDHACGWGVGAAACGRGVGGTMHVGGVWVEVTCGYW